MKSSYDFHNDSDIISEDFIKQNPEISIPYLTVLVICTVSRCIGNVLVIGSVISYKVRNTLISANSQSAEKT